MNSSSVSECDGFNLNLHLIFVGEHVIDRFSWKDETTRKSESATTDSTKNSHSTSSTVTQSGALKKFSNEDFYCEDIEIVRKDTRIQLNNNKIQNIVHESYQKEDFKSVCVAERKRKKVDKKDHQIYRGLSKHLKCNRNENLPCTTQKLEGTFIQKDDKLQNHEENNKIMGNEEQYLNGASNGSCRESANVEDALLLESKERVAAAHLDTGCEGGKESNKTTKPSHITEIFAAKQHNSLLESRRECHLIESRAKEDESKDKLADSRSKDGLNVDDKEQTDVTKLPLKPQIFDRMRISLVKRRKKRGSEIEKKKKKETVESTREGETCNNKKGRSKIFSKLRFGKKKEADEEQTEGIVETKDSLKMPSEKDSVKDLMKKGAKSMMKRKKSKNDKEEDNKEQLQKQHKKEEKEKRKKEDKKRKLKERYERVMSKQKLENLEFSTEYYSKCYGEKGKRVEKLESSGSNSSSGDSCSEGSVKHTESEAKDYARSRDRAVSIAWDDASVSKNSIDDGKANRITALFAAKEHNSAIENNRRSSLSEPTTIEDRCKEKEDSKIVAENTQNNNNYIDEERMKRIVELFAAKEHNAAILKSRAKKANGLNATGNGPKPDSEEVIQLDQNGSRNDGTQRKTRRVVRCAKTPLQKTDHQKNPHVVSTSHSAQNQSMKKLVMRITDVDTC